MAFNMATLLEEDEVTLMLAQHHVSEARQLLAKARRRDASDIEQTLRSVETAPDGYRAALISASATARPAFCPLSPGRPGRGFRFRNAFRRAAAMLERKLDQSDDLITQECRPSCTQEQAAGYAN